MVSIGWVRWEKTWYATVREASAMERAAGMNAAGGQPGVLDELKWHWGSAYDIAVAGGGWTARRRDGRGGILADPLPGGLLLRIRADYAALPVPRGMP